MILLCGVLFLLGLYFAVEAYDKRCEEEYLKVRELSFKVACANWNSYLKNSGSFESWEWGTGKFGAWLECKFVEKGGGHLKNGKTRY